MSKTKRGVTERSKDLVISREQALEILQSAIGYCQRAGLAVKYVDSASGLTLYLPGSHLVKTDNNKAHFILATETGQHD